MRPVCSVRTHCSPRGLLNSRRGQAFPASRQDQGKAIGRLRGRSWTRWPTLGITAFTPSAILGAAVAPTRWRCSRRCPGLRQKHYTTLSPRTLRHPEAFPKHRVRHTWHCGRTWRRIFARGPERVLCDVRFICSYWHSSSTGFH
ncbi:hypothetical protein AC579_1753 [Pseudocercospora musae]|uniref:Uncharacterized protein n=1 Tax=Pseudocercospora musae TaxID=113226 RepID=A0A139INY7_9PEZI|nr:hypothetical protein AC579_1753 [Pseudocercospora musae]